MSNYPARIENKLRLKRLGIDSYQESILFIRADSTVCRSEGFEARTRVIVRHGDRTLIATINVVHSDILSDEEVSLSESAWLKLNAQEGDHIGLFHLEHPKSLSLLRSKLFGHPLSHEAFGVIISDVVSGVYSDVHLAAFVTACSGDRLNLDEVCGLTESMIEAGSRIRWPYPRVVDKHCVGGLPGNRTTPIVVSIVASCGLIMPKTSSRAITSPAGTADTVEVMTPVALSLEQIKAVVEREGACIAWGGTAALSPADDILIRIERALDLDSEGQLVASVLSKKAALGSTDVVIDIPVGETAKVRSEEGFRRLSALLTDVGTRVGLHVNVLRTDGSQPVGRGIGPTLEARDVMQVLRCEAGAAQDLRDRSIQIAGKILEMSGHSKAGSGEMDAMFALDQGKALKKFMSICEAQGGFSEPRVGGLFSVVSSAGSGVVTRIDNRALSLIAKLAGAPKAKKAGVDFHAPLGKRVEHGDPLFTVYAESPGELEYAMSYLAQSAPVVELT